MYRSREVLHGGTGDHLGCGGSRGNIKIISIYLHISNMIFQGKNVLHYGLRTVNKLFFTLMSRIIKCIFLNDSIRYLAINYNIEHSIPLPF